MVHTEQENNGCAGGSGNGSGIMAFNVDFTANGSAIKVETSGTNSTGLDGYSLRTYKRRKSLKATEGGKGLEDSVSQITEKSMNPLLDSVPFTNINMQVSDSQKVPDALMNSYDCSLKQQRNYVLEQICQSLESEGGLKKCIQNALLFHPGSGSLSTLKDSIPSENGSKCSLPSRFVRDDIQSAAPGSVGKTSSGSVNESNHRTGTELSWSMFSDIIMSEKFAQLCNLLLENFQGLKAEKLLDLSLINSRMKEGAYESSPVLFYSDIQQVWKKLQKVGTDMITLAKCLSDKSNTSFRTQVGSSVHDIPEDCRHEFLTQESDMHAKEEQTEACPTFEVGTCRCCGEKSDGKNSLVCDSCEEMYHISCIEPAVKEIPLRSWYCPNCTAKGIESPHDDCIACERLNASRSPIDADGEDDLVDDEAPEELEDSSNEIVGDELQLVERGERFQNCKVCGAQVRNDEDYRICGHSFCSQKFFHVRCLTSKQLKSYGPCWYCPSCLCRACLRDQDDDKIVLCDGCDHAYHIYCMQPPCTRIPKGKWFCKKCDSDLQRVQRAKWMYENTQNKSKMRASDGTIKGEEGLDKAGGVDMLLNAAKTLIYEENRAAMGLSS
ncbi:PHD finger EHD3 isoform X1 [Olea europaea subsp. europaea]|uniref:PHD finger EHD3 isoform X1 n=1 Tax=Olea europaea subsp. europaea TaxID=158383 RepID=A0A8S0QUS3_OLEEU|nr:PHD finger EHD3 isoform X1 [Olea europaea subsp. europaea]